MAAVQAKATSCKSTANDLNYLASLSSGLSRVLSHPAFSPPHWVGTLTSPFPPFHPSLGLGLSTGLTHPLRPVCWNSVKPAPTRPLPPCDATIDVLLKILTTKLDFGSFFRSSKSSGLSRVPSLPAFSLPHWVGALSSPFPPFHPSLSWDSLMNYLVTKSLSPNVFWKHFFGLQRGRPMSLQITPPCQ